LKTPLESTQPKSIIDRKAIDQFVPVTADYNQVTVAIGTEIQKALQGGKTPEEALSDASDQVTDIVKARAS
jgi:maltose-binding protein MalE